MPDLKNEDALARSQSSDIELQTELREAIHDKKNLKQILESWPDIKFYIAAVAMDNDGYPILHSLVNKLLNELPKLDKDKDLDENLDEELKDLNDKLEVLNDKPENLLALIFNKLSKGGLLLKALKVENKHEHSLLHHAAHDPNLLLLLLKFLEKDCAEAVTTVLNNDNGHSILQAVFNNEHKEAGLLKKLLESLSEEERYKLLTQHTVKPVYNETRITGERLVQELNIPLKFYTVHTEIMLESLAPRQRVPAIKTINAGQEREQKLLEIAIQLQKKEHPNLVEAIKKVENIQSTPESRLQLLEDTHELLANPATYESYINKAEKFLSNSADKLYDLSAYQAKLTLGALVAASLLMASVAGFIAVGGFAFAPAIITLSLGIGVAILTLAHVPEYKSAKKSEPEYKNQQEIGRSMYTFACNFFNSKPPQAEADFQPELKEEGALSL